MINVDSKNTSMLEIVDLKQNQRASFLVLWYNNWAKSKLKYEHTIKIECAFNKTASACGDFVLLSPDPLSGHHPWHWSSCIDFIIRQCGTNSQWISGSWGALFQITLLWNLYHCFNYAACWRFAECTSNCVTCSYDIDGINLCQKCEQRFALSVDSLTCNRKQSSFSHSHLPCHSSTAVPNYDAVITILKFTSAHGPTVNEWLHVESDFLPDFKCNDSQLNVGHFYESSSSWNKYGATWRKTTSQHYQGVMMCNRSCRRRSIKGAKERS